MHAFEDHTAEVRVRLEAETMPALFAEAGRALAELFAPEPSSLATSDRLTREEVVVRASDRDALLVEWLNELVFRSEVDKCVFPDPEVLSVSDRELRATLRGAPVEELRTAVKAATMHGLRIEERAGGGVRATVILDV